MMLNKVRRTCERCLLHMRHPRSVMARVMFTVIEELSNLNDQDKSYDNTNNESIIAEPEMVSHELYGQSYLLR